MYIPLFLEKELRELKIGLDDKIQFSSGAICWGEYKVKNLKLCPDARMSWAKLFPNLRGAKGAELQFFWIFIQNYLKFRILLL